MLFNRLILIAFILVGGLFGSRQAAAQVMSVDSFARQLAQVSKPQLIDVRTPAEFGEGHLPNAVNINVQGTDFTQSLARLDKNKPVYVYCLSGGRTKTAVEQMRAQGFGTIYELRGGYLKWAGRMMPLAGVTRSKAAPEWSTQRLDSLVRSESLVLVDVYAPWCGPCRKMAPILSQLSEEMKGKAVILKLNADTEKDIMKAYGVDEIPALMVFRNGQLTTRKTGFQDEPALRAMLATNP